MAKKRKAQNKCAICGQFMKLKRIIPEAHIFPELKTFQCGGCGNLRTVEDEAELAIPEVAQPVAA